MELGPDFRHYESFVAIAEECSFRKAAEKLHISQPALSGQIKELEAWVGHRVLHRGRSGSALTEPGRNLLVYARYLLHLRRDAKKASSRKHSAMEWPLRLGYSPFINHILIDEALTAYNEIVPDGRINSSSDCTAHLIEMLEDGRLDAAIVTLPIFETQLAQEFICRDKLLICLRKDDPLALESEIPKSAIADRLRIMFERSYHPLFHDDILKGFKKAGISLKPTETFSAPSEMQFMVKKRGCFGLVREGIPLDPELTALPMKGINLRVANALVFNAQQEKPILPMLAYRMIQRCARRSAGTARKPVAAAPNPTHIGNRRAG
jgi:DNA-binding transcriptional LysR family regulator